MIFTNIKKDPLLNKKEDNIGEKYPKEVQEELDYLKKYSKDESGELEEFDIIHLYGGEIAYPDGYCDSRFFKLVAYNTEKMLYNEWDNRDGITFTNGVDIDFIRIFLDGSTLIKFKKMIYLDIFQDVRVYSSTDDTILRHKY